jgi:DNA-binding winged helix-turn-helix (wHTH) protein
VLRLLLHSTGKVVAKERLMEQVWQREATGESWVLTTIIKKLRKKLEAVPVEIVNCYGKGYRLTTGYAI